MKRVGIILLAFSMGLNAALLYDKLLRRPHLEDPPPHVDAAPHRERPRLHGDSLPHRVADRYFERRMHRMADRLDLTDTQRAAIRDIHQASAGRIMRMRHATRAIRDSFHTLMAEPDFDSEQFRQLGTELHERQRALENAIMDNLIREAEVLTPAQRTIYQDMMMRPFKPGRGGRGRRH